MTQPNGNYQFEIYFQGLLGELPALPMAFHELEVRAAQALPPSVWSYVRAGAGDEHTQNANVSAFSQWGLLPRMLVGATDRDLSVELWGKRWHAPIFMSPIGVIGLCSPDGHGDVATAKAAAATGVPGTVKLIGGLVIRAYRSRVVRRFWWKAPSQFTFRRRSWSPR